MTTLVKLTLGLAAVYVAVVALMALAQDWLIFPHWAIGEGGIALPAEAERLSVAAASGERLAGLRLPPPTGADPGALILGFGGNAWDADGLALFLRSLFPEREVVAFHYRGYGPSEGRPSAKALLDDALAIHDHLEGGRRIVAVGLSIGAGPAAHLAAQRPLAGAILVTPFDSLMAMARDQYPWAPVRLLLRHRMEVAEAVAAAAVPMAMLTAEHDGIVPARRTAPVRAAARDLVLDRTIAGAGHNDLYQHPDFAPSMREALVRIEARSDADGG